MTKQSLYKQGLPRLLWSLAVTVFFFATPAHAFDIPSRPDGDVTDRAEVISEGAQQKLERTLYQYEQQSGIQIVVATFPSIENGSLEEISVRLAEAWKIGTAGKDNGIIFLVFPNDKKMRIEVGYGLEGVLPDARAGEILRTYVAPLFQKGDFENGIFSGLSAILETLNQDTSITNRKGPKVPQEQMILSILSFLPFLFPIALILFLLDLFRYYRYFRHQKTYRSGYSFWGWWFRFSILLFVISMIFRMMFYAMLFSRGGYGGGRGSGGFSGGGGGRFGGGGASGGW